MVMDAMVFNGPGRPLDLTEVKVPQPEKDQVLLAVKACAVCRTDLHIIDGELKSPKLPLIPGHEIVGVVIHKGELADRFALGDTVGVPWLGWTCGMCEFCRAGRENLCDDARFTGYQIDGGFAEFAVADERFCFLIPKGYADSQAAPLLCAGVIGHRALSMAGQVKRLGIYGFGVAAHLVVQVARHQGIEVYAFTRPGDSNAQTFAKELGAVWTGSSNETAPVLLDAAIIFAPVGELVPLALRAVAKGGTVICAGIHMSDIPSFPYVNLWEERVVRSVANLTRQDVLDFFKVVPHTSVKSRITSYPLSKANEAIDDFRQGRISGAAVLIPQQPAKIARL